MSPQLCLLSDNSRATLPVTSGDVEGVVHEIDQGEGGEQGDPLMPLLFSLGQHAALRAVQRQLQLLG